MTNSLKLAFLKTHYTTSTDSNGCKIVECKVVCAMHLILPYTKKVEKKYPHVNFGYSRGDTNTISTGCGFSLTAVATCHKDDKFEFNVGKHLSESRAKAKAYNLASRIVSDIIKDYIEPAKTANEQVEKLVGYYNDEIAHIAKLKG